MANEIRELMKREKPFIVGREPEIEWFTQWLTSPADRYARILHVYGTGGVGKTHF